MTIGHVPIFETLVLVPGQDFQHEILAPVGETIPAATTVELVIYEESGTEFATWNALVTGTSASWDIASEISDTVQIPASFRIYVHYSDGADFCWYRGVVAREEK